ncbi:MAG: hypothetical protein R6V83_00420 [Candidatus Thorarchaeota archaeon]
MNNFPKVLEIKDPIHGYIGLSQAEKSILDLRMTQRLRNIRRPASTNLVYPGAVTSSMSSMLGTLHVTGLLFDYLGADSEDIRKARIASILHSVSCGPWSNVMDEYLSTRGIDRVRMAELTITKSRLGDVLEEHGYSPKEAVQWLSEGVPIKGLHLNLETCPINPELIDRLERDSYFAGVEYAQIELQRLFSAARIAKNKLAIERGALYTLESYLSAGANMFDAVYYHKTVRAAELMLLRILDLAGGEIFESPRDDLVGFLRLDDLSLRYILLHPPANASKSFERANNLFSDYSRRYLIKLASERAISNVDFLDKIDTHDGRFAIETEIAEAADIAPRNVYLDYPSRISVCHYPGRIDLDNLVLYERGSRGYDFWAVTDMSMIARSFRRLAKSVRVYTTRGYRSRVRKAADELLESIGP